MDQTFLANEMFTMREVMGVASIAVGLVFTYAAASKLLDLSSFIVGIRGYNVMPARLVPLAAGLLIVGECLIAVAHFAGIALQFVVPGAIALLSVFFVTMANQLKSGERRPCLCFGASHDDLADIYSLVRIILLLSVEGTLFFYLLVNGGSISVGTRNVYDIAVSVSVAALVVVLIGWFLSLPRFYRALNVVNS